MKMGIERERDTPRRDDTESICLPKCHGQDLVGMGVVFWHGHDLVLPVTGGRRRALNVDPALRLGYCSFFGIGI